MLVVGKFNGLHVYLLWWQVTDGLPIDTTSTVSPQAGSDPNQPAYNQSQLHVIFDTGYTIPQLPQNVVDAIYGRVPGGQWSPGSPSYWQIPCDYELNVSFVFGGVQFPVAPLDLNLVAETYDDGTPVSCMAGVSRICGIMIHEEGVLTRAFVDF